MQARRIAVGTLGVPLIILSASCVDVSDPVAPAGEDTLVSAQARLVGAPGMERLVRDVPGFGGMYLDEDGVANVYLTDLEWNRAAEVEVTDFLSRRSEKIRGVRVREAQFTLSELDEWYLAASPVMLDGSGAVFVDLDEAANRVTIGIEDGAAESEIRERALRLGIPDDAIRVVETEAIHPMSLRGLHRPTVGGLQINFPGYLCTLGFNAEATVSGGGGGGGGGGRGGGGGGGGGRGNNRSTSEGTAAATTLEDSFVTNSHCTTTQGGTEATEYGQPSLSSPIGTEVDDPDYLGWKRAPGCPRGAKCRWSDAARARYADGVTHSLGVIARPTGAPNSGSYAWDGASLFNITADNGAEDQEALMGSTVNKVGRTTGWTEGEVTGTCVNTGVSGSNVVLLCQTWVYRAGAQIVGGGDSGSSVFEITSGDDVTLLGLLWGGSGDGSRFVYSPLANVVKELGALRTH